MKRLTHTHRTALRLPAELLDKLKIDAANAGISMSAYIRRIIENHYSK